MEKTVLNIKTDKKIKQEAQEVAHDLGLPLGTILNAWLRELIREKRVLFAIPPTPNQRLQKLLKIVEHDKKKKKKSAGPFTYAEAFSYLDTL